MRKVVYNACFGGFNMSRDAIILARELSGNPFWGEVTLHGEKYPNGSTCIKQFTWNTNYPSDIARHDPVLVAVVEKLHHDASGGSANLQIAEVQHRYRIEEYDGNETVMEPKDYIFID